MKSILLIFLSSFSVVLYSQTVTPGTITDPGSNWCPGGPVNVPYSVTGIFNPGNLFILQMSDDGGTTFTSPQNVDTIAGTSSGTFNSIVPMGTSWTSRSFRIIATDPAYISTPSNTIFLQFTPLLNFIPNSGPFCLGLSIGLEASLSCNWTGPNGHNATSVTNIIINNPTYADTGMYYVTLTNGHGCTNSDTFHLILNAPPTVNFNYPGTDTVCTWYGNQALSGGTPIGGNYSGTGVTGTNFNPGAAGVGNHNISYTYTDTNGCSNSAAISITVLGCIGIDPNENPEMVIYPNPFIDHIYVEGIKDDQCVVLYNRLGQMEGSWLLNPNQSFIRTDDLTSGIYFLKIGNKMYKLIRQ